MKKFPTLYKKTSTGADQEWNISVEDNVIITKWGQVKGKIQETRDVIKEGKNVGKANETSPEQQAQIEAESQWDKKLKKGYVQSIADAREGKTDDVIEGGIFPMLAKKYSEQADKIEWPAFAQPKLDGHRCIAIIKNGVCTLWSRTRKPITSVPHINKALETKCSGIDIVFDGELYSHEYKEKFEELTSFIRQEVPKEGHEVVQYHIYDVVNNDVFSKRCALKDSFNFKGTLVPVETLQVNNEEELMEAFDEFLEQGYEGCMVRNAKGLYVSKRSNDLQKVKTFDDDEFKIVGVEEGRGKLAGKGIFVCVTSEGVEFRAKMRGSLDSLKEYLENPKKIIGSMLTVKFQGYTKKNNVPRFPIGERFKIDL